jgi:hypothetical protein
MPPCSAWSRGPSRVDSPHLARPERAMDEGPPSSRKWCVHTQRVVHATCCVARRREMLAAHRRRGGARTLTGGPPSWLDRSAGSGRLVVDGHRHACGCPCLMTLCIGEDVNAATRRGLLAHDSRGHANAGYPARIHESRPPTPCVLVGARRKRRPPTSTRHRPGPSR